MAAPTTTFKSYAELPAVPEERLVELRAQVIALSQIIQPAQRSKEWYDMRNGMITASDWGTILGQNKYESRDSVLRKKIGMGTPFTGNIYTQWGQKYEAVAVQIYERRNGTHVQEFGLIQHPEYSFLGASPDGITADGVMLEIKCPPKREINGIIPSGYYCQIQAQLEVCKLDRCDFLECRIEEYARAEDYFEARAAAAALDSSTPQLESGALLCFYDTKERLAKYDYLPIWVSREELESGIGARQAEIRAAHPTWLVATPAVTFWKLTQVSCVPVYRDQQWFAEALPLLSDFWTEICEIRAGTRAPPAERPKRSLESDFDVNIPLPGVNIFSRKGKGGAGGAASITQELSALSARDATETKPRGPVNPLAKGVNPFAKKR